VPLRLQGGSERLANPEIIVNDQYVHCLMLDRAAPNGNFNDRPTERQP
jgi:hypothetical protein